MSKRRISHQQSTRIEKKQKHYRQQAETGGPGLTADGLVITRYSSHALVESPEGKQMRCSIRPHVDALVAGDRVLWQAEGSGQGVVISCYPRQSLLGRPDKHGQMRPVAANISQLMIVVAPKPLISWPLLDSYLVMAEYLNLQACIILNKIDLACPTLRQQLLQGYEHLGYPILFTSLGDKKSYKQLQEKLDQQTSVFVGQSGVGKSTLIAGILPLQPNIQIASISAHTDLGCHTTSNSYLYHLPTGGALIDSPGVRNFGLWHMPLEAIAKGYREFRPYLTQCKFRNCNHRDTPGCALIMAVNKNLVTHNRYENYVKISLQFAK